MLFLDVSKHQLDINEVAVFVKQAVYYLSTVNGHFVEARKKNYYKLFPRKQIQGYIDQNKLNLSKDLITVFLYAGRD